MELNKISPSPNFSVFGFKVKIYETEIPKEKQDKINNLIKISDDIYHLPDIVIKMEEKIDPRFSAKQGKIFIPSDYIEKGDNIISILKNFLGDKFEDLIIFHEMGHAVEVSRKQNVNKISIKNNLDLNYLINGSSVSNNLNYFLIENYKEGFADCYSGLCFFKKYGDISIFDKISKTRELRYVEMKNSNGNHYVHPNFNTHAAKTFKKIVEDLSNKKIDIRDLPFLSNNGNNIERYIEESAIKGLLAAVIKELKINDAFLNEFKIFGKQFTEEDRGRFKINIYSEPIKKYSISNNIQTKDLVKNLNSEGILPYFIEFQKRSVSELISDKLIEDLIDNKDLRRHVDPKLRIEDIRNFQIEDNMEAKEKIVFKINSIRFKSNNQEVNNLLKNTK